MDLKPTAPLGGFLELTPAKQRFFDVSAAKMRHVLEIAGFEHVDLPAIERAEVLTDEDDWSETATQMYLFQKGDTKMGLRYDGTVGLARFVAGHLNDLVFPCRISQYSKRYRGERQQKGRFREFYQLDMDILGLGALSSNYDAEIVGLMAGIFDAVPEIFGDYVINIGSRPFWNEFAKSAGLSKEQTANAFALIDKKEKLDAADFEQGLAEAVGAGCAAEILSVFSDGYGKFANKTDGLAKACAELADFMKLLEKTGVKRARLNLATMRGLGYYDGIVYEAISNTYPEIGSIGGGGRYGNLVGRFSKTAVIGSGCAIGVNRAIMAALDSGRIDLEKYKSAVDVAVLVMGKNEVPYAMNVLAKLRENGIVAAPFLDTDKKFKNQMEFADKISSEFSVIIGEVEVKNGTITLKNMKTGEQVAITPDEAVKKLLKIRTCSKELK